MPILKIGEPVPRIYKHPSFYNRPPEKIQVSIEEMEEALKDLEDVKEVVRKGGWIIIKTSRKAHKVRDDAYQKIKDKGLNVPLSVSSIDPYALVIPYEFRREPIEIKIAPVLPVNRRSFGKDAEEGLAMVIRGYIDRETRDYLKKLGFQYNYNTSGYTKTYGTNIDSFKKDLKVVLERLEDQPYIIHPPIEDRRTDFLSKENREQLEKWYIENEGKEISLDELISKVLDEYHLIKDAYYEYLVEAEEQKQKKLASLEPTFITIEETLKLYSQYLNIQTLYKLINEGKIRLERRLNPSPFRREEAIICIVPLTQLTQEEYSKLKKELTLLNAERGSGTCRWYIDRATLPSKEKLYTLINEKELFLSKMKDYLTTRNNKIALEYIENQNYLYTKHKEEHCLLPTQYLGNKTWNSINKSFTRVGCYWNRNIKGWCCPEPPTKNTHKTHDPRLTSMIKRIK